MATKITTTPETAAAAEAAIGAIKNLMTAVGNDETLKQKLEDTLAALTGKRSEDADGEEAETAASGADDEEKEKDAEETSAVDEDEDEDSDDDTEDSDDDDEDSDDDDDFDDYASDVFDENMIGGLVIGVVAGAALVGGGVLLHKLISKD